MTRVFALQAQAIRRRNEAVAKTSILWLQGRGFYLAMSDIISKNVSFLRNVFSKGPFQGHAFCCSPKGVSAVDCPEGDFTISQAPVDNWVPWVVDHHARMVKMLEAVGDDGVPYGRINTGTHIFAAAFGCPVHTMEDDAPFALPMVSSVAEAEAVKEPDLWKSPTLYRVFELAEKVTHELGPEAHITGPDMQSGFDIASLIWNKEDMFCAMLTDPEAVMNLAGKAARLFKTFLTEYRGAFPQACPCHCPEVWTPPEMGPWMSNDECGSFSTSNFETFCLPELVDLAETFGGLGMHCCADAEHQFDSFKKIPNFYGFNRVAAKQGYQSLLEYFDDETGPVHVLAWIEEEDITRLIQEAVPGVRFVFNLIEDDVEVAKAWYDKMRTHSLRTD